MYTALFGGYERLLEQPVARASGVDFVCFTDDPTLSSESWQVRLVDAPFPDDSVRSARAVKIGGARLLGDHDVSLWIDNCVILQRDPREFVALLGDGDMVLPFHSFRASLRDEYIAVLRAGLDDPDIVRRQWRLIDSAGLGAARPHWTAILTRRNVPAVHDAMRTWLDEVLRHSRRDQLSFEYAMSRAGFEFSSLTIDNRVSHLHVWTPIEQLDRRLETRRWSPPLGADPEQRDRAPVAEH